MNLYSSLLTFHCQKNLLQWVFNCFFTSRLDHTLQFTLDAGGDQLASPGSSGLQSCAFPSSLKTVIRHTISMKAVMLAPDNVGYIVGTSKMFVVILC